MRRQRDTAAPCAESFGLEPVIDARFDEYVDRDILEHHSSVHAGLEIRPGDQAMSSRDFQELLNVALRAWIAAGAEGPCREPWPSFVGRLTAALEDLARGLGKGQSALVVSSGGSIAALTASLLGVPPETMVALNHVSINTGITKLTVGRGGINVASINEHAHLEGPGGSLVTYR